MFTRNPARRGRRNPWNRRRWEFNSSQAGHYNVKVLLSSVGLGSEQVFCLFRENISVHSWKSESLRHGDLGKTPASVLLCQRCCAVYKVPRSCMWFASLPARCWECGLRGSRRYWCASSCCLSAKLSLIVTGQQFALVSIFPFRQIGRQSVETRVRWYAAVFLLLLLLLLRDPGSHPSNIDNTDSHTRPEPRITAADGVAAE